MQKFHLVACIVQSINPFSSSSVYAFFNYCFHCSIQCSVHSIQFSSFHGLFNCFHCSIVSIVQSNVHDQLQFIPFSSVQFSSVHSIVQLFNQIIYFHVVKKFISFPIDVNQLLFSFVRTIKLLLICFQKSIALCVLLHSKFPLLPSNQEFNHLICNYINAEVPFVSIVQSISPFSSVQFIPLLNCFHCSIQCSVHSIQFSSFHCSIVQSNQLLSYCEEVHFIVSNRCESVTFKIKLLLICFQKPIALCVL